MGFFFQDSWRIKPNLTLNYGVRYDVELIASPPPLNAVSQAGYDYLGLVNGIPQDNNNVAPRIGLAWDPFKDGKTVVRASYGLFYDHPLLGLQFLAQATDAVGTPQVLLGPGAPCSASGSLSPGNGNATNTFQGILQLPTCAGPFAAGFGYDPTQQRFTTNFPNSLWINQNFLNPVGPLPNTPLGFLPFGFPLAKGFQYAYSNQANFSIERDLGKGFALTVGYSFNGGRHLNRPINSNTVNTGFLVSNWERAVAAALAAGLTPNSKNFPSQPFDVGVEDPSFPMYQPCGVAAGGVYVPAPLVNFFRPSGLNPSLTAFGGACTGLAAAVDASLFPGINPATGFPNSAPSGIPFSDMTPNYSNGSSVYHGLTANLRKRFSGHYEFLASYTWAHTIDDSTDLQSPLAPQDSHLPSAERSNSTFDQRHRFVFSGVYQSGKVAGEGFLRKLLSDWTIAPIIEVGSGRPFTVLTGVQANFQFAPNSARPNAVPSGTAANPICNNTPVASAFSPAGFFQVPCFVDADVTAAILTGNPALIDGNFTDSLNGNLGRNTANKPTTVFTDMRVARRIHLTERLALDGMVDMFNFVNKFNVADVNPLYTIAGQPTAAYDPRQFQFALRLSW
jgi:hypothetical protein